MTVKYQMLTLVEDRVGKSADGHILARWLCDCGTTADFARSRVKHGYVKSCGCEKLAAMSRAATTHGGRYTPEYSSWAAMRRRCLKPTDKDYPRYGGRGITVCPQWIDSFETFRDDMGPRPAGMTLDRINGSLGYDPSNTRWAPAKVQGRNRRGTYVWHIRGKTFGSITEAAAEFGVSEHSVFRWVNGQFDKRRNSFTPPRKDCSVEERYA